MKRIVFALFLIACAATAQEFAITPPELLPSPHAWEPAVAASADRYLIVWSESELGAALATRLDASGNALDFPPLWISGAGGACAVTSAGNGDFLVARRTSSGSQLVRVTRDGAIVDKGAANLSESVALAWNGTHAIAADHQTLTLFDGQGTLIAGPVAMPRMSEPVAAASDGRGFLLIGHNGNDVETFPVDGEGRVNGPPVSVASLTDAPNVALASDGARYLVVTAGTSLRTQIVFPDGSAAAAPQVTRLPWAAASVRATWDGTNYIVAWNSNYQVSPTVVRVSRDGALLDAGTALPVRATGPSPVSLALAPANGGAIIVTGNGSVGRIAVDDASVAAKSIPAPVPVALAARMQWQPSIAPIPGGAVVAWAEETDDRAAPMVRLAIVDSDGRPTGRTAAMLDLPRPSDAARTHVGFDGKYVIVVCNTYTAVYMQRFTLDLAPVDSTAFLIAPSAVGETLAAGDGVSLIAWSNIQCCSSITPTAVLLRGADDPLPLPLRLYDAGEIEMAAAWNGREFLLLSNSIFSNPLVAVRIAPDGTLLDAAPRPILSQSIRFSRGLRLASNGDDFFALWAALDPSYNATLAGIRIAANGTPGTPLTLFQSTSEFVPLLAAMGSNYETAALRAWDPLTATAELRWHFGGTAKSIAFTPAAPDHNWRVGGGLAQSGNKLLAVYARLDAGAGLTWRVFVQAIERQRPHAAGR